MPGGPPPPRVTYEVYNWTTGTWRSLPAVGRPQFAYIITPIQPTEVNSGMVRHRVRTENLNNSPGVGTNAKLLLTSSTANDGATIG